MDVLRLPLLLGIIWAAAGQEVHGVVSTPQGKPIQGINLRAVGGRYPAMSPERSTTDSGGYYAIDSLDVGYKYELRVECKRFWRTCPGFGVLTATPVAGFTTSLNSVNEQSFTVPVTRVIMNLNANGEPATGARVGMLNKKQALGYTQSYVTAAAGENGQLQMWLIPGQAVFRVTYRFRSYKVFLAVGNEITVKNVTLNTPTPTPRNHSTPAPWNYSTPAPWNYSTPAPWNHSTPAPWNYSTPAPWNYSTPAPWNHSTPAPWNHSTPAPTNQSSGCAAVKVPRKGFKEVRRAGVENNLSLCWTLLCPGKGKVLFEWLSLEDRYDWLVMDAKQYSGSTTPDSRVFYRQLRLRLTSDGNTPSRGFSAIVVCY